MDILNTYFFLINSGGIGNDSRRVDESYLCDSLSYLRLHPRLE